MDKLFWLIVISGSFFLGYIFSTYTYNHLQGSGIDWELTIGFLSLFVALNAFFISFFITKKTIEHNKISVKPHLRNL